MVTESTQARILPENIAGEVAGQGAACGILNEVMSVGSQTSGDISRGCFQAAVARDNAMAEVSLPMVGQPTAFGIGFSPT